MADGALHELVDELRRRRGWTMDRLAEVAGVSEQAVRRALDRPATLSSGDATVRALSRALQVDAWLLERAAAAPRENLDELVRLAERVSGGNLSRLRDIAGTAVPETLDEAVRLARSTVSPGWQLELAHLVTLFTHLDEHDRQLLLAVAARLVQEPSPDSSG